MKKFLAGFFLPLCIFLLSGFGPGYAYAYRGCITKNTPVSASSPTTEHNRDIVVKSPSGMESFRMVDVTEIQENEETSSSRKHLSNNTGIIAIFYLQMLGCLNLPTRKTLSFSKHLFDLSSQRRHLVFGVIRI